MNSSLTIDIRNFKLKFEDIRRITAFLKDVEKFPLLSFEEEDKISQRIAKGDSRAVSELVNSNLRFVVKAASKFKLPQFGVSFEDLVSSGYHALIEAAPRWDSSKKVRFLSYAVDRIAGKMWACLNNHGRMIRIPFNQIHSAKKELSELTETNESLIVDSIQELWFKEKDPIAAQINCQCVYLDEVLATKEDGEFSPFDIESVDFLRDEYAVHGETALMVDSFYLDLVRVLNTMETIDVTMIIAFFSLDHVRISRCHDIIFGSKDSTTCKVFLGYQWDNIEDSVKLGRGWCHGIKNRAIVRMQKSMRSKHLVGYLQSQFETLVE